MLCYNRYMQTVSRLLDYFVPENYNMSLTMDRPGRSFEGTVTIRGVRPDDSTQLLVHAKGLQITSAAVDGKTAKYTFGENDEVTILHPDYIKSHSHVVVLSFRGTITDAMHGLYPCYYKQDGIEKEILATQFESHYAREVFPCIDEPAAKATFDVTLTTEPDVSVLGNMTIKTSRIENDQLVTQFETSPRMSTYLLAWVAGELEATRGVTKDGVDVAIWSTPAQPSNSRDFALDIAIRTIEFFNDYFGIAYPLTKSDHVALPDFSNGAMENWGLITYRETTLLAEPGNISLTAKHYIATVIAHELSHQWFGNLVTMQWWNDLWLNESFATLMEFIAIDALEPSWNIWLDFAGTETIAALRRDAIDGVQSVQIDVHHPDEISTIFDGAIVYAKGARLLRMLQQYIGHEAFKAGLTTYFKEYAYKNTKASDLWAHLEQSSGKPIADFMTAWLTQPGYPVVHIAIEGESQLTLNQKQFFTGPASPAEPPRIWPIPLLSAAPQLPELFDRADMSLSTVAGRKDIENLRLNVGNGAHFLTHYSSDILDTLLEKDTFSKLNTLDTLQLLDEQLLLARGRVVSYAPLIGQLPQYTTRPIEAIWDVVAGAIGDLKSFVADDESSERRLKEYVYALVSPLYDELGWTPVNDEPEELTKLRPIIVGLSLYAEHPDALSTAHTMYHSTKLSLLNPELRALIIGSEVRWHESTDLIESLLKAHHLTNSASVQEDIVSGVTSTKNRTTAAQLLETIKSPKLVRPQDAVRWYIRLLRGRETHDTAWNWLQNNWEWVHSTFGSDKTYDSFVRYSAAFLKTREELDQFNAFFTPMETEPALSRVIKMGKTEIQGRIELLEAETELVRAALIS